MRCWGGRHRQQKHRGQLGRAEADASGDGGSVGAAAPRRADWECAPGVVVVLFDVGCLKDDV